MVGLVADSGGVGATGIGERARPPELGLLPKEPE